MIYNSFEDTGLLRVLKFLKAHDTEYLSGQDLSDVLHISRVAVWKHIKKIQALGYTVESKQKEGYKLTKKSDLLLPWEVISELGTKTLGQQAYYYDSVESTQNEALKIANKSKDEGIIIIAEKQTGGKGRSGRKWISPKGGIWFSIILHPKFDISNITLFPIASSLALSIAIEKTCKISTELKWPNDLIFQQQKCGGILLESSTSEGRIRIGVGLNKDAREIEGVSYTGWKDYFGDINADDMFQIIDASISSILDSSPPIENSSEILWQQKSWIKLSEILSRGVATQYDEKTVNVVGLSNTGELNAISATSKHEIQDVGDFFIAF